MEIVNAVSKVRFASSGSQHVHLARGDSLRVDLICMEPGQKDRVAEGPCAYYVVTGSAVLAPGGSADGQPLPAGHLAELADGERCTLANAGEARLICLMIHPPK